MNFFSCVLMQLMGVNLDGVRKDMQAVKDKIKTLVQERDIIKNEITKLDAEVTAATESRDAAYKKLWELRNQRDKGVCSFSFHSNHVSLSLFFL